MLIENQYENYLFSSHRVNGQWPMTIVFSSAIGFILFAGILIVCSSALSMKIFKNLWLLAHNYLLKGHLALIGLNVQLNLTMGVVVKCT